MEQLLSGGEAATYVVECFRPYALDPDQHVASFLHGVDRRANAADDGGDARAPSDNFSCDPDLGHAINYELKHLTDVRDLN